MKKAVRTKPETDSTYFLKILVYFVIGSIWIKFNGMVVFPLGLIIGLALTSKDHFAIDRKIEYAVLLVSAILGLTGWGFYLAIGHAA